MGSQKKESSDVLHYFSRLRNADVHREVKNSQRSITVKIKETLNLNIKGGEAELIKYSSWIEKFFKEKIIFLKRLTEKFKSFIQQKITTKDKDREGEGSKVESEVKYKLPKEVKNKKGETVTYKLSTFEVVPLCTLYVKKLERVIKEAKRENIL